jgi:hypothetical protein
VRELRTASQLLLRIANQLLLRSARSPVCSLLLVRGLDRHGFIEVIAPAMLDVHEQAIAVQLPVKSSRLGVAIREARDTLDTRRR